MTKKKTDESPATVADVVELIEHGPAEESAPMETSAPVKRGRGRPAGTGKTSAPKTKADSARLGKQIVGIHLLAANFVGLPELMISDAEGVMLADASNAIAEEYGIAISGKAGAAMQLIAALGMVYGPRAVMISRKVNARKSQAQPQPERTAHAQPANFMPVDTGAFGERVQ